MGYSALIVYGVLAIIGLTSARTLYVADVRARKERRKKGVPMEWQESKEYQ